MTWENMYDTILVGKSKLLERIYGNLPPRFGKSKETMYKTVFLGTVSDFGKQVWTTFSLWQKSNWHSRNIWISSLWEKVLSRVKSLSAPRYLPIYKTTYFFKKSTKVISFLIFLKFLTFKSKINKKKYFHIFI